MSLKHYNGGKLYSSHLEEDWMLEYVNRRPLIGNEDRSFFEDNEGRSYIWYKR
jgi:hypothetical protein